MADRAQDIIFLINQYTSELEKLDQLNNTYIMTCVGAIGVILGIIATVICGDQKVWKTPSYRILAPLFLSIPVIVCIFLGVVTLNCRKVAMYRVYLKYLEDSYNKTGNVISQYYNSDMLQFLKKWSTDNRDGSVMNRIINIAAVAILSVIFISCFIFSYKSFRKTTTVKGYGTEKRKRLFYITYIFIILICILMSFACLYDLVINPVTLEKFLTNFQS